MPERTHPHASRRPTVALLTGGGDRPYALGLAASLAARNAMIDFVGSDDLRAPEVCENSNVRFLNLRGDQSPERPLVLKAAHLAIYYLRLFRYAVRSPAPIFHILWNNKFEWFDRTLLTLLYLTLGKRIALTLHNVNREARDGTDTLPNRLTLKIQYALSHHLFVHTLLMKQELEAEYRVPARKISVIPFPVNDTVPTTALTQGEARQRLGLDGASKVVLFFGNIAPYKGLQHLVDAMADVTTSVPDCYLVIAGRPKPESHWIALRQRIAALNLQPRVIERIEYIRDEETEVFFKAADVLVLPYVQVFQSGVLFLAYNFGLPVIVTDTGSLKDYVFSDVTGLVCPPENADALARGIQQYFSSSLYRELETNRDQIRRIGRELYSWDAVSQTTIDVYSKLMARHWSGRWAAAPEDAAAGRPVARR